MRSIRRLLPLSLLVLAFAVPTASALQAGALDPGFATGGTFRADLGSGNADGFEAIAQGADGSIFAAGGAYDSVTAHQTPFVAKFTPGGALDPSFGSGGVARLTTPIVAYAKAILVQADGRIMISGNYGSSDLFVARLTSTGAPDATYAAGAGYLTRNWGSPADVGGIAATPDGGVVVAGTAGTGNTAVFTYQRFAPEGANYTGGYKSSGAVGRGLGTAGNPAHGMVGTGDGGFYAVGTATIDGKQQLFVYRIDGEGYPVDGFAGGSPYVTTGAGLLGFAVALQPDGKVVASGDAVTGATTFAQAVVRFQTNGALDPGFGSGGVAVVPPLGNERNYAVALQPDGKIVAAGSANDETQFSIVRLDANGAIDPLFGLGGRVALSLEPVGATASGVLAQGSGRIIAAGGTSSADTQEAANSALVGVLENGQPPVSAIQSPSKSKLARKKFSKIAGTAGPVGDVAKVEIAIRRIDAKRLKQKRCVWIKSNKGAIRTVKDKTKKCAAQVWLKTSGTTAWSYKLKKSLPVGSYRIYSRTTLTNGIVQTGFSTGSKSLRKLTLTKK